MEKPKILGIVEDPTEVDLESVRSNEEVSVWFSLNDLIRNPDYVTTLASLTKDKKISDDLLKIPSLEINSENSFEFLDEVNKLIDSYQKLEKEMDHPIRERFTEDLFVYLDKFNIQVDRDVLFNRLRDLSVNFVDYVRYFGQAIKNGVDIQEACTLSGYYVQDGDCITINMTAIDSFVGKLDLEETEREESRKEVIESTLRHELVHAASYRNYWLTENQEDGEPQTDARRSGIKNISFNGEKIRLTWLNEAIIERVNQETSHKPKVNIVFYQKEQEVLNALCEYVGWEPFLSACFTKDGFLELGRVIKEKTGLTLSEIDNAMAEDEKEDFANNRAIQLIKKSI